MRCGYTSNGAGRAQHTWPHLFVDFMTRTCHLMYKVLLPGLAYKTIALGPDRKSVV